MYKNKQVRAEICQLLLQLPKNLRPRRERVLQTVDKIAYGSYYSAHSDGPIPLSQIIKSVKDRDLDIKNIYIKAYTQEDCDGYEYQAVTINQYAPQTDNEYRNVIRETAANCDKLNEIDRFKIWARVNLGLDIQAYQAELILKKMGRA